MDKSQCFDRNLLALSQRNAELCAQLSRAETTLKRYKFLQARSGEVIPACLDDRGSAHPLHSIVSPCKEAERVAAAMASSGFLVFLGLGGGYYIEAALKYSEVSFVLVVEYDCNGLAELLCHKDYSSVFSDPRVRIVCDVSPSQLEQCILELYQPSLYGKISVVPLRSRTALQPEVFIPVVNAMSAAIDRVSADYSVQAHFGKRWLSNILRNIESAGKFQDIVPPIRKVAISAAGPSLSKHLPHLAEKRSDFFLIAVDTSLPCLLHAGIKPDAVISIDCQHISYYHFMDALPRDVFLFLDLASPPLLSLRAKRTQFFSGGHPLTRYISRVYRPLAELDTSGGNVTYAAVSLAEHLGARTIELYGADFSYPEGVSYAHGTYIYSLFAKRQTRFSPLEAQSSSFLFRTPLEKKYRGSSWYYETKALTFYRERLEEKCQRLEAQVISYDTSGAPITLPQRSNNTRQELRFFSSGKPAMSSAAFLRHYQSQLLALPHPDNNAAQYLASLDREQYAVFATLLPTAASLTKDAPLASFQELFAKTKEYCLNEIEALLGRA